MKHEGAVADSLLFEVLSSQIQQLTARFSEARTEAEGFRLYPLCASGDSLQSS